jgi:glycosyltransferase involved in cell wall biosynthesis
MEPIQKKSEVERLPTPVRLTEQEWPKGTVPIVSIWCITYNHVQFIRDAIEGFLMQETTFPVEIFIHDDASTDGTADIVREYAAKYPSLFWTVLQKENQWSQATGRILGYLQQQRGLFVALCEGDDYWTDATKLQLQVESIESTQGCVGSCHVTREFSDSSECLRLLGDWQKPTLSMRDIIGPVTPWHTSSFVGRKEVFEKLGSWVTRVLSADMAIFMEHSAAGCIVCIPRIMSAYRNHSGGITRQNYWVTRFHKERIRLWKTIDRHVTHNEPELIQAIIRHHKKEQRKSAFAFAQRLFALPQFVWSAKRKTQVCAQSIRNRIFRMV